MNNIEEIYHAAKSDKWFKGLAVFCRITLALGFIISAIVKIRGERFAAGLPVNNPMGHYLEALYYTEFYYTFIGFAQLLIGILLLVPRTAALGALMCFPVILNICILTYAVRFEGTRITTFMLLASIYLLCWYFDRLKYILPIKQDKEDKNPEREKPLSNKFRLLFFGSVIATMAAVVVINMYLYDIRPGNSAEECRNGCPGNSNPKACEEFCDCIYIQGKPLRECLAQYKKANATATHR